MANDFTLEIYEELCKTISCVQTDCRLIHHLENNSISNIILRHDVDRKPKNALRMAYLEHRIGVRATYYFRCVPATFDTKIIRQISEMGHEIGYHYEVMSKAKGNMQKANVIFKEDIENLRAICDIRTACMHGSPGSRYNNLQFWEANLPEHYGLIGEAYLNIHGISEYFTDTGGQWNSDHNLRDRIPGCAMRKIKNTGKLMYLLRSQNLTRYYITVHPERWASNGIEALQYSAFDASCNKIKILVRAIRRVNTRKGLLK